MPALRFRHVRRMADIAPQAWDAMFDTSDYPFVRHAWLHGLETHGCVSERDGWEPCHLIAEDQASGRLMAAAPLYLKHHSYGEFVFDFAWADASHRLGRRYYPKYLCAVPYVPSSGPRLGATSAEVRRQLADHLAGLTGREARSSAHVLFADDQAATALRDSGDYAERLDVQFHWHNRGYTDMAAFLASFTSEKRKKLQRERRRVAEAGIRFEVRSGRELGDAEWDHVYRLYANTYHERGQLPYLTREFLADAGRAADLDLRLVFAHHDTRVVAMAILLASDNALYGRHWGAEAHYDSLHFECCYYQGIELCLREGLARFDAGTQGMHKLGRGFDPLLTRSFHHLTEPRLRDAVEDYLQHEREAVGARLREFMQHRPYRSDTGLAAGQHV